MFKYELILKLSSLLSRYVVSFLLPEVTGSFSIGTIVYTSEILEKTRK